MSTFLPSSLFPISPRRPLSSPSSPYPFPSLPLEVGPLKLASWSGERCKLPQRGPNPKTNLVHSIAVRKPLVAITLNILKCMFYITWSEKLDYRPQPRGVLTPAYASGVLVLRLMPTLTRR